jgi:hypothetical protein
MTKKNDSKVNNLKVMAQFVLFVTSYLPLFILVIVRQIYENHSFMNFSGFNFEAIVLFFQKFGLSVILMSVSLFGLLGCSLIFKNLEKDATNGDNVTILNVNNKNSESIGYIATYIIPFLFQNFSDWYEFFAFSFVMFVIYRIYINSNLILINPILSFKYSIFEIEYKLQNGKTKNGLIISDNKYLEEDSNIKIYEIGFKLFYCKNKIKP